jgi:hypothetical protein
MILRAFFIVIACSFSYSSISQKHQGTVKENPLKVTKKAIPVQAYETQKAGKDQLAAEDVKEPDITLHEETILHKLQICESKIAHSPNEELSKQYEVLRKEFVNFIKNSNMSELSAPEKTKYMRLMKEEGDIEEYSKAKNSLRGK